MDNYIRGLISVIIPTRGRTDTLERAINSALSQSYRNIEVFVVDDNDIGSEMTQNVVSIISGFRDDRLHLVQQEKHINGAAARNAGITRSNGEFIAFLDDDDWWEKEKLAHQIECFSKLDESYGAVTCLKKYYLNGNIVRASVPHKQGYICKEVLSRCIGLSMGAPLIKRSALDDTGYFDDTLLRMQDVQLFSSLCSKYKVFLLKEYLYCISGDDSQNRSKSIDVQKIKADFLQSVQPILDRMDKKDREFVRIMTDFDMGYSYLKNRKIKEATPLLLEIFKQRDTLKYAIHRVVSRVRAKYLKKFNLKRYGV